MRIYSAARRFARPVGALAAAAAMAGCSTDLLAVDTPDVLSETAIAGSLGATTLRNGSLQDFIVAFSGSGDGYVVASGNLGDEIQTTDTFADRYNTDARNQNENLGGAINTTYNNLQLARAGMSSAIEAWVKAKGTAAAVKDSLADMYSVRGYTETFFAEGYCSGVPFSRVAADGSFEYGDPLTTAQMLTRALASFDSALAQGTGTNARALASIGKARVLLNQGQFAQAAAAVSGVATTFRYQAFHSAATGRQNNGVFGSTYQNASRYSAGTREGVNGIDYMTTPADPRAPWTPNGHTSFDDAGRRTPRQEKYNALNSAATLADGIEARLIEAEARLNATTGGSQADRDAVVVLLNTLRATGLAAPITPALVAATTQDAAVDQFFRERALWLWLTGHRLGDMRRLIRQYGRTAANTFPTGGMGYRPGNTYGADVNLIVPFNERNNPKFTGCINRNP